MRTRSLRSGVYLAAGAGLIVSIYSAYETAHAGAGICNINAYISCSAVATSGHTTTFGIQDYWLGIGGFLLIIAVAAVAEQQRNYATAVALAFVTSLGVAMAAYFLYLEVAVIGALCLVCVAAYLMGVAAWLPSLLILRRTSLRAQKTKGRAEADDGNPPSDGTPSQADTPP